MVLVDSATAARHRAAGWWRNETILDDVLRVAADAPHRLAIAGHHGDGSCERLTFGDLVRHTERFATELVGLGVRPGEVVSMQLPNWWEFAALHLACTRIGAVTNPILPILRHREVRFILARTGSRVCVAPTRFRRFDHGRMLLDIQRETPTLEHLVLIGDDVPEGAHSIAAWYGPPDDSVSPSGLSAGAPASADSPAQIIFTSGTTGEPKGVVHTYNTVALSVRAGPDVLGITPDDVMLMSSPLAHNTGFMYGMSMPLMTGMRMVLQDIWDPRRALELIEAEGVTVTMGSTTFLLDLCEAARTHQAEVSTLRLFICGGAPIPPSAAKLAREVLGAELVSCWGMTENGIATATRPGDPDDKIAGTDGAPMPWVEVKVVDEHGAEQPPGVAGRLFVRGPNGHVAYLGRPDLYEASFVDGWFDTGDLARIDTDGYVRITGRAKDVIIRGGENIPALEVEGALIEHPAVREVAVVGVPDARFGECACAVVVPADPGAPPTLDQLREHLTRIGMTKVFWPERLEVRPELPRTASGKVQKFVLRDELAHSSARRASI